MHFKCQTKIYKHAYEAYWSHGDKPHFTHENIGVSPVKVGLFSPGDLKLKPVFFLPIKIANINNTIEFTMFKLNLAHNFRLKIQFKVFRPNLPKTVFPVKNIKNNHQHQIRCTWIGLATKFQLKQTFLKFFWAKLAEKGQSQLKTAIIHITIKFTILDLGLVPYFHLKRCPLSKMIIAMELSRLKLVCNPGHNILELYNILVEIWFTTSKMKLDI